MDDGCDTLMAEMELEICDERRCQCCYIKRKRKENCWRMIMEMIARKILIRRTNLVIMLVLGHNLVLDLL